MRARACLVVLASLVLGACAGAGRDQCMRAAVSEVRTLVRLIAETEAGLARGYGIDRQTVPYRERRRCGDGGGSCIYSETERGETPATIATTADTGRIA